uniref:Uncharacterized protein n=1 Tax=Anopheles coluzzii TaxID=1518534 RepID=A0A8W7PGD1_ANOCL
MLCPFQAADTTTARGTLAAIMSTAKRLVLSLRGRKESHGTAGTSSTRLVSANSTSPGHELDEIAVVSVGAESGHVSYGSLSLGHTNGPRYIPGCHHRDTIKASGPGQTIHFGAPSRSLVKIAAVQHHQGVPKLRVFLRFVSPRPSPVIEGWENGVGFLTL